MKKSNFLYTFLFLFLFFSENLHDYGCKKFLSIMQCPTYSSSVLDFYINRRGNCKLEKEEDKAKKEKVMEKLLEQETTNIKTK